MLYFVNCTLLTKGAVANSVRGLNSDHAECQGSGKQTGNRPEQYGRHKQLINNGSKYTIETTYLL